MLKFDSNKWGHQIKGEWVGRVGWGLYCFIIQCRFMSNTTDTSTQYMIHDEKERERMGIELNEQKKKMNITQLCWVWLCFCEDSASVSTYIYFLSERVRVTVWAGASLSLSVCVTCVREASKRQLPVNWSAGRLGAARHWVKSSEVRRSCVSCRWRLCQRSQSFGKDGPACHAVSL